MKKKVSFSLFAGLVYNLILVNNSGQNLAGNYVNCGGVAFPTGVVDVVHILILLLQIVVPIIVIILGSIDFAKATAGKNQDDILKKQKLFIKRLVAAGATFLIVSFVTLVVNMASDSTQLSSCAKCLTSGSSGCGSAASPNNPEFPSDNQLSSGNDSFNGYKLKENAYGKDNSNKPDNSSNQNSSSNNPPGTTVIGPSDLSKYGTGSNPNDTAPAQGTVVKEQPSGTEVKALFTAYYPYNNAMEGGFYDCRGHKLQPSKQTCAAPASVPYGSIMWIKSIDGSGYQDYVGRPYVVTDRGGAINIQNGVYHFDLLFKDGTSANNFGRRTGSAVLVNK